MYIIPQDQLLKQKASWSIPGLLPQLLLRSFEVKIPKLGSVWPGKMRNSLNTTNEEFHAR